MGRRGLWIVVMAGLVLLAGAILLLFGNGRAEEEASPPAAPPPAPSAAAASGPGPAAAVPSGPPDLAAILTLSPTCELGAPLAAIFERMVVIDPETYEASRGRPVTVPGFADPIAPTFEREVERLDPGGHLRHVTAGLPLLGRWHGLAVTGLDFDFYEESDVAGRRIRFADPPERAREALAAAGFDLPPVGEFREMEGEGMLPSIGIERLPDGSALTCTTG